MDKVGVETQRIALWPELLARVLNTDDLTRSQTDHRAFLIIVPLTTVNQFAVLLVFQEHHIKAECMPHVAHGSGF